MVHALWPVRSPCTLLPPTVTMPINDHPSVCHLHRTSPRRPGIPKKRVSSPCSFPGADCIKLTGDPILYLGTTMLSYPHSLHLSIQSSHIPGSFKGLVDLGFSMCFVDSNFVVINGLAYWAIVPLPVALIDGTVNAFVTQSVSLPIELACGYTCTLELFMTKLEGTFPVILGHSWLVKHNLEIDWKTGTIQFSILKLQEKNQGTKTEPRNTRKTSLEPSPGCPKLPHTSP